MINKKSIDAIEKNRDSIKKFTKPDFKKYCFANIPGTISKLLGLNLNYSHLPEDTVGEYKTYKKVVFMFIDAFGWSFFERYKDQYPALKKLINNGIVSKITSQFPSTTSAHVTTIHTGKSVAESGVYEWFYYEPEVDDIIMPLLNSYARNTKSLLNDGYENNKLYPENNFYKKLKENGKNVYTYQPSRIIGSTYNDYILKDAVKIGFKTLSEGLIKLKNDIKTKDGLFFYYYPEIDSICHSYGPNSEEFDGEVHNFLTLLNDIFIEKLNSEDTAILISADHGQAYVDIQKPYYINIEIPEIENYIQKNKKGNLIVPSGSCRDFFLHIKPEYEDFVLNLLKEKLKNIADVRKTKDMMNEGYFGYNISEKFEKKVGNLVILAYEDNSVWWYEKGTFEVFLKGMHGGLFSEEMEIPFIFYNK